MDKKEQRKQYWFVIQELTSREIKRKYARSKLGIVWSVLNPLLTMIVISLVFSKMFSRSIEHYPIYYLCGNVLWSLFTNATNSAMTSIVDNRMMLIKVKFPMQIFVMARVYTALVNFLYSLIAFGLVLGFFIVTTDMTLSWHLLWFPVIIICLLLFSLGIAYILAVAYVFFGDVKHLYNVLLTLWLYLSAMFYPVSSLPEIMQKFIHANPIFDCIDCLRAVVLCGTMPPLWEILIIAIVGVSMYLIGYFVFSHNRNSIMQKL